MDTNKDKEVIEYIAPEGKMIQQRCNKNSLAKRGLYDYVMQRYNDNSMTDENMILSESLYRILHGIEKIPKCVMCGNTIKYKRNRYISHCSQKCTNTDPDVIRLNAAGVSKALKKKYQECGEEIKKKRAKTLQEKYGDTNGACTAFGSKQIQKRIKKIILEKYGVENVLSLEKFRNGGDLKLKAKYKQQWKERGLDVDYPEPHMVTIHNACPVHGDVTLSTTHFRNRSRNWYATGKTDYFCLDCYPLDMFSSIEDKIKQFLDTTGFKYSANTRSVIAPYELDFYLPIKKIAIECNGNWYHSVQSGTEDNYHYNKWQLCDSKGISLFNIWEDWICHKADAVNWMLTRILMPVNEPASRYSGAEIKIISNTEAEQFCSQYGLFCYRYFDQPSCVCAGVFLDGRLIKVLVGCNVQDMLVVTDIVSVPGYAAYSVNRDAAQLLLKHTGLDSLRCLCSNDFYDERDCLSAGCRYCYVTAPGYSYILYSSMEDFAERIDTIPVIPSTIPAEDAVDTYFKCQNSGFRLYSAD